MKSTLILAWLFTMAFLLSVAQIIYLQFFNTEEIGNYSLFLVVLTSFGTFMMTIGTWAKYFQDEDYESRERQLDQLSDSLIRKSSAKNEYKKNG